MGHASGGDEGWEWREVWFGNGASVAFAIRPGHGPPVLLLHGRPGGAEQGRVFADELFPPVRKRLVEQPPPSPLVLQEGKLPPYTFIAVSRPASAPHSDGNVDRSLTPEEQEADLYSLLLDELDISRVAVMSLPGAHSAASAFAERHGDKCWAVVQVAADARGFDNCLTSSLDALCAWTPPFFRQLVARSTAFVVSHLAQYDRVAELLPCLSVTGSDRATRLLQARLVGTTVPCASSPLSTPTHASAATVPTSGAATIPWLQAVGSGETEGDPTRTATLTEKSYRVVATVPGLVGGRLAFAPRQLGPLLEQFLEKATQFLVW